MFDDQNTDEASAAKNSQGRQISRRSLLKAAAATGLAAQGLSALLEAHDAQAARASNTTTLTWAVPAVAKENRQAVADLWNKQHPTTPVKLYLLPAAADQQRQQIALALNARSSLFDLIAIDVIWTGEFANNGWLEQVDDLIPTLTKATLPGPLQSAQWQGHQWAIPYVTNAAFLYYRKDLLSSVPKTWDELVQVSQAAAKKANIAPFVGQGAKYEGFICNYLEYMWGAGGALFNGNDTKVLFNQHGEGLKALQFMRTSVQDGFYASGFNTMMEEDARNYFQAGKAVLMRNWPYAVSLMNQKGASKVAGQFGIAPLPTFGGQGTVSTLGGLNNAISNYSHNKALARQFAIFAGTDLAAQVQMGKMTEPPTLRAAYTTLASDPVFKLLAVVLPKSLPRPPVPKYAKISTYMQNELYPAYNGQKDLTSAVNNVAKYLASAV
jgi:multiple sugar transport system substrate-binding protein